MTLPEYLADYRAKFPKAAEIPDAELARLVSFKPDFNPEWLNPQAAPAQVAQEVAPVDTSYSSAFLSGAAQPVAAIGETAQVVGEVADSETLKSAGQFLSQAKEFVPKNYKSASEEFVKTWDLSLLPRAVTEQSGQLLGSVASRVVGGLVGGLVTSPTAAGTGPVGPAVGVGIGQAAGPALFEAFQLLGSVARDRARNDGRTEVTKEDLGYALGTAAVSGTLNSIGDRYLGGQGGAFLSRLKKAMFGEGLTEMGQSVAEQVGGSVDTKAGVQVDLRQAAAEGVLGAGAAGAFTTALAPFTQEAAPAPEAEQTQATTKPNFSLGDIKPPTVERPEYVATATTAGGEELQFVGATEEEAAAKREAYIAESTPGDEEGAVEKAPDVIEALKGLGLSADQIKVLSPQDAIALIERVEASRPDFTSDAEAEAKFARSTLNLNILRNAALGEKYNQELAAQRAQGLQEQQAARAKLSATIQRVTALEAKIAENKAKEAEAKQRAAEARAATEGAKAATSEARSTLAWNKRVEITGEPVTSTEVPTPGAIVSPLTQSQQAKKPEGIPAGKIRVAETPTPEGSETAPEINVTATDGTVIGTNAKPTGVTHKGAAGEVYYEVAYTNPADGTTATSLVPAGSLRSASGEVWAPPAQEPAKPTGQEPDKTTGQEPAKPTPSLAPLPAASAPIEEDEGLRVLGTPKDPARATVGGAQRGSTRFAAIFQDAQGNQFAVPVFYKGKDETNLRVLLTGSSKLEVLGRTAANPKRAGFIEAALKAGYPIDNETTVEEFAKGRGLTYMNTLVFSKTPLTAGVYQNPVGFTAAAPTPQAEAPVKSQAETPTKPVVKLTQAEQALMALRRGLSVSGAPVAPEQVAEVLKTAKPRDALTFLEKDLPFFHKQALKQENPKAFASALLASMDQTLAADQEMKFDTLKAMADEESDVASEFEDMSEEELKSQGLHISDNAKSGKTVRASKPKRPKKTKDPQADLELMTRVSKLKAEPIQTQYPVAQEDANEAFAKGDYTLAARLYRHAAKLVLEDQGEAGMKKAAGLHAQADKALKEIAAVAKRAGATIKIPNYLKSAKLEETVIPAGDIRYAINEDALTGLTDALLGQAVTVVSEGRASYTSFTLPNAEIVEALIARASNSKSAKAKAWATAVLESGITPKEISDRFVRAAKESTDVESPTPDLQKMANLFGKMITGPGAASQKEVLRTDRDLTPKESLELKNYREEVDTIQLLRNLAARGVNVMFTNMKNAVAGRFTDGHVAVFADMADRFSTTTFGVALHEAVHHFTSKLSPAARLALHRGVDQLAARLVGRSDIDARVGYKSYAEYVAAYNKGQGTAPAAVDANAGPLLSPEAWAEEVIAETARLNGMSSPVSRTLWSMIMRQVKLLALRVNMYLQEQILGPDAVNSDYVSKWVDAQIEATIAGDTLRMMSFMGQYLGLRPTLGQMAINSVDARNEWQASAMDPVTGKITHVTPLGLSSSAIQNAILMSVEAFKRDAMLTGAWNRDANLKEVMAVVQPGTPAPTGAAQANASLLVQFAKQEAVPKVAAAMEIKKPFEAAYAKIASLLPEFNEASRALAKRKGERLPDAATREYVASLIGLKLPETVISEAQESLARVIKNEMGVDAPPDLVSEKTTLDSITSVATKHRAYEELSKVVTDVANKVAAKEAKYREELLEAEAAQVKAAAVLAKYATDPADWTSHQRHISDSIAESFRQIIKDNDRLTKADVQLAEVSSILTQLATSKAERESLDANLQKILAYVSVDGLSLNSIMGELLTLEDSATHRVDFSKDAKTIRDTILAYVKANRGKTNLDVLTNQTSEGDLRGSALLSALITYIRRNELAVDLMRSTIVKGKQDTAALVEFQTFMRSAADERVFEAAALLEAQRQMPTNRFVQKALNARDKFTKAANDAAQLRRDLAILQTMRGTFDQAQKLAEAELNTIGDLYEHSETAQYAHPTSVTDSIEKIYEPTRIKTVGKTSSAELRKVIRDVQAYLEYNKNRPESQGHLYNKLQRQNTAMLHALTGDGPKKAMSFLTNARLRGWAESFRGSGTKGGDRQAARATRHSALYAQFSTPVKKYSSIYERAAENFKTAAGIKNHADFYENFYTPANGLEQVYHGDQAEIRDQIDRWFSSNERTKGAWARPGAKKAFWAFLDATAKAAEGLTEMQNVAGAGLVWDPNAKNPETGKLGVYRRQLMRGLRTFPMHTSKVLENWANSVPDKFRVDGTVHIFAKTPGDLVMTAAERRADMAEFLGKDGWNEFLAPILTNDITGVPGPASADGRHYPLNSSRAKAMAAQANGDFYLFAELAHRDSETTESLEDYTRHLENHVGRIWGQVNAATRSIEPDSASLMRAPGIPNIGLDARATQDWPIGWKAPMEFTEMAMRRAASGISATAAYGRDLSGARKDIADMEKEIEAKLAEIKGRYATRGIDITEAIRAHRSPLELARIGIGTDDWQQYNALLSYKNKKWMDELARVLDKEDTIGLSDPFAMQMWGVYVMNLTAGAFSALKNPVSGLNQFALAGEFSADSVKDTLGNYGQLFKQLASSVTGSILPFYKPGARDVNAQARRAAGIYDPITDTRLMDSLKGGYGAGGDTPPTTRFIRRLSEVVKDTRLGFSFGKDIVALRAFDWFGYTQLLTQLSAVDNNLDIYYEIVQAMASYARAGGDISSAPSAKQMGLRGSENRLKHMLKAYEDVGGSDFLTLAYEIAKNPKMSELEIKTRMVPVVNKITADRISAEGSLSANPSWISESTLGRVGGTFLGWQWRQMGNLARPFMDAETNVVTGASLMRAVGVIALGMMPGMIAYSMLLDMWDELTEKKRDKIAFRLDSSQTGEQRMQAAIEAFNTMGALSFLWEVPNQIVNTYQGTAGKGPLFSVDNRIVVLGAMNNFFRTFRDLVAYGPENITWSTSGIQMMNTLGLSAQIGNLDLINRATRGAVENVPVLGGFVSSAAERQDRITLSNYIRSAGRELSLPVRQYGAFTGETAPSKVTPHINDMQLAALEKDEARFDQAKKRAFEEAQKQTPFANPAEAWKVVVNKYTQKHPLRNNFTEPLTNEQINTLMAHIDKRYPGKAATIKQALGDFNSMGLRKLPGFKPLLGASKQSLAVQEERVAQQRGKTVEELRRELAKAREPKW